MTEQEKTSINTPITIAIDVQELLKSELGWRHATPISTNGDPDDWDDDVEYGNGKLIDLVAFKLAAEIKADASRAIREVVKERALAQVDTLIEEILAGTVTLTSEYGEAKSPAMTIREAMIKAMTDRLECNVDANGKKIDRNSYGSGTSYLVWHSQRAAQNVLDKELTGQINAAVKQIKTAAQQLVTNKIGEALGRALS